MIKCIIFDIDDTLLDHYRGYYESMEYLKYFLRVNSYVEKQYNFSYFIDEYNNLNNSLWREFENGSINIDQIIKRRFIYIFEVFNVEKKHRAIFERIFLKTYIKNCNIIGEWDKILGEFYNLGLSMIICSNGLKSIQLEKLHFTSISGFFSSFYFGTSNPNCKPNKIFYENILNENNLKPEEVIMVGDNYENDIVPCQLLNMKTLHFSKKEDFSFIKSLLIGMINEK
ncbi:HAD family hydrolase [Xenorhabdus nematophila]|uniref:HAD family hydrolase n=1 Tax=Xenorhabdus nematophila TaxID=628 RepID=UPI000543D1D5|nr:HAD family hydrolase [Xenorhabdus nematophila]CEF28991.1 hypothetical protein XNW1_1490005 [Xenorhabdus nematophila str. Websteri]AYA41963.1 HAD family hydrolase [Xenorhabdus nematophila]MBA0020686.1 HAD family hydrolase [Xenorhabdus nematophila]MCB4426749.1 HAD-IA family hydrolase [Xenorhabdus nematophila]QNJ36339.1 HAD family hydrolase [Xenorhabdus nematophila]